jgi:hypothetical protein
MMQTLETPVYSYPFVDGEISPDWPGGAIFNRDWRTGGGSTGKTEGIPQ